MSDADWLPDVDDFLDDDSDSDTSEDSGNICPECGAHSFEIDDLGSCSDCYMSAGDE